MKKSFLQLASIWIFFCAFLFVQNVEAKNWYVRPVTGEYGDESGADYANAIDGWAALNGKWNEIQPGDVIFFCGKFIPEQEANRIYIGKSGSASGGYIYIKSCTTANGATTNDPWIVDWRTPLPNWSDSQLWKSSGDNVYFFKIDSPYFPRRIYFSKNGEYIEGQRICSDGSVPNLGADYEWYLDYASSLLYVYARTNPASYYSGIKTNNYLHQADGIVASNVSYIDISGLTAYGCGGLRTLRLTAVNHFRIHGITWTETSAIAQIEGSSTAPWNSSEYIDIYDNYFDSGFNLNNSDARCMDSSLGAGVNLLNSVRYCSIYRNTFKNFMKTIALLGATVSDQWPYGVEDVDIYENDISCPDLEYGYVLLSGGSTGPLADGFLKNIKIYMNYFHDYSVFITLNGNNISFYNNVLKNVFESSRSGKAAVSSGLSVGMGTGNKVYNNTIVNVDEVGIQIGDYGYQFSGCEITNNILVNCGLDDTPDWYSGVHGNYSIRVHDDKEGEVPNNFKFQNNLIFNDKRDMNAKEIYYKNNTYTVAAWNDAAVNNDTIAGNKFANPVLNADLSLAENSPAIDNGADLSDEYDFGIKSGSTWTQHVSVVKQTEFGKYDIGAFVYGANVSLTAPQNFKLINK